jgi:hypothetical protein
MGGEAGWRTAPATHARLAVPGVGGWSPDGRFLLAGARTSYYYFDELVVIDCANDSFAAIASLGEGNQGPLCTWVKRTLLT